MPRTSEVALLLSMTGFGEARLQDQRWTIVVEVRTVNNRHFKLSAKISETYATIEPALEQLVREKVRRGTVQLQSADRRPRRPEDYRLNLVALASYRDQLKGLRGFDERPLDLGAAAGLAGRRRRLSLAGSRSPTKTGPRSPRSSSEALAKLESARAAEGRAMAAELTALGRGIERSIEPDRRARAAGRPDLPEAAHRAGLRPWSRTGRDGRAQGPGQGGRDPGRPVRHHRGDRPASRPSDPVLRRSSTSPRARAGSSSSSCQEMGREINTIGSKANDVEISRSVVEVKALLEKIRELVQNVE